MDFTHCSCTMVDPRPVCFGNSEIRTEKCQLSIFKTYTLYTIVYSKYTMRVSYRKNGHWDILIFFSVGGHLFFCNIKKCIPQNHIFFTKYMFAFRNTVFEYKCNTKNVLLSRFLISLKSIFLKFHWLKITGFLSSKVHFS